MIKTAQVDHEVHDFIKNRWSPRFFDDKRVEKEKILSLFESARWASSARNQQPWMFVYAAKDNRESYHKLLECANENNRTWMLTAPLLVLAVIKNDTQDNKPNRHAMYDLGLATGNIMFQATSLGLYVHVIGGFDSEKARTNFNISSAYSPVMMIAVGYLGKPDVLPEKFRVQETSPRTRKKIEEFAFEGIFKA